MADFEKKETLIEIEIDTKGAFSEVEKLTDAILDQQKTISANNDSIKTLNKTNQELSKQAKEGVITQKEANKGIDENNKKVTNLQKANFALKDELKDLNSERNNAIKVTKLQSNSLDALRKTVADQKKELNGLNTATEEGKKRFEELTEALKENNDKIVEADQNAGDFKTTIGRYREETGKAIGDSKAFGGAIGSTGQAMESAGGRASQLWNILKANPLLFIVGLIAGLVKSFLDTQKGMDALTSVTRPLHAIFERFKGVLQELATNIFKKLTDAFKDPIGAIKEMGELIKENLLNRFEALGKFAPAIAKIFSGELVAGFKDLGNATLQLGTGVQNVIDKIGEAARATGSWINQGIDAGTKLDQLTKQIERAEISLTTRRAELNVEFERQKSIAEDVTKSESERVAAAKAAQAAVNELLNAEQNVLDLKIERMELEQTLNDTSREGEKDLADLIAQRTEFEAASTGKRVSVRNLENTILAQIAAAEKARVDQANKDREEQLKKDGEAAAKKLANQRTLDSKLEELANFKRERDNELALQAATTDEERFNLKLEQQVERFDIEQEQLAEQREIGLENQELSNEERLALEADFDLKLEQLKATHENALIAIAKEGDKSEADNDKKAKDEELKREQELAKSIEAIRNQAFATTKTTSDAFFSTQDASMQARHSKELTDLDKQLKSGQVTQEFYDDKKEKLDKRNAKSAYDLQVKQFNVNKCISLVETGINTAKGIANALGSFPPPVSFVMAALVGAMGAAQAIAIGTKKPPSPPSFEFGGDVLAMTIGGRRHAQGGTRYWGEDGNSFEVEQGEGMFVTRREATNPALRALSSINESYGGRSFFDTPKQHLQQGGAVTGSGFNVADIEAIVRATNESTPPPQVNVVDIMSGIQGNSKAKRTGII